MKLFFLKRVLERETDSWDGKKILYSADTDDTHDNIFLVEVPKELL